MDCPAVRIDDTPPYPHYRILKSRFGHLQYLDWLLVSRTDEAIDDRITAALAGALVSCGSVLFLHSRYPRPSAGRWTCESTGTWRTRKRSGFIPGIRRWWQFCLRSDPQVVQGLFDDDYYSWHMRGQIAFLFSSEQRPEALRLDAIIRAVETQDGTNLGDCIGYMRPGDDGNFAELGLNTHDSLDFFISRLAAGSIRIAP